MLGTALHLIKVTRQQIQDLRAMKTESVYENLFSETKLFCEAHDLEEHDLAEVRTSRKKKMNGEMCSDDRLTSANYRYVCEVYRCTLDVILTKLDDRFSGSENIFKEFSLLLPEHLELNKDSPNKFHYLINWLSANRINKSGLNVEYELFASNYKNFINSATANDIQIQSKHFIIIKLIILKNDTDSDDFEETIHVTAIYSALCKMGMTSAFPNVFMPCKGICTLPPTSATAERCFPSLNSLKPNYALLLEKKG